MRNLVAEDKKYILNVYKRINLEIVKGEGTYLYDKDGNKYFDMYSGISVNNLGHTKEIIPILMEQATKFMHLSNYFVSESSVNLAKLLVESTFADKVFFTNSGTEANEAVIKLARKYGKKFSTDKTQILAATNSFHGRTCGSLTLTGQGKYQKDFRPLLPDVNHFEFNDLEDLKSKVSDRTCAVFIETIQGEGGIVEITKEFIDTLIRFSEKYNFLIVVDEIQTGLGRTGDLFGFEKFDFTPHIVTIAKSLGGGLPLGAMIIREDLVDVLQPGDHGSTFGGNPVACAAGGYVITKVTEEGFLQKVKNNSDYLIEELNKLKAKYPNIIKEIRGRGLMIGINVEDYADIIKETAFKHKLLLNITNQSILRLLPILNITIEELNEFLSLFDMVLNDVNLKVEAE